MRFHPKSNAIEKHGEWNWIKERFLQDFKDEQKETKAEWIKERMALGTQKLSRCQQKRTQVWMKTYLCWRKTELKQSYIPII